MVCFALDSKHTAGSSHVANGAFANAPSIELKMFKDSSCIGGEGE